MLTYLKFAVRGSLYGVKASTPFAAHGNSSL